MSVTQEFQTILTGLQAEHSKALARLAAAQEAADELQRKITTIQDALDIAMEFGGENAPLPEPERDRLSKMTIKQMIISLASEKDPPVFKVTDMNRRLVRAGMFRDMAAAAAGVYPVLGRNKDIFHRVSPGKYRVLQPELNGLRPASQGDGQSGLRERVAELRQEHPDWTRGQVADELVKAGWDFGSKRPVFAVNACFANAGRHGKD